MKIKTEDLKRILRKLSPAVKKISGENQGVSIPASLFIKFDIINNILYAKSTDGANTITVDYKFEDSIENEDFIIEGNAFLKLVSKTTSAFIELTKLDNCIEFIGNGKYLLEQNVILTPTDLNFFSLDTEEVETFYNIKKSDINNLIKINGVTLYTAQNKQYYDNYFLTKNTCITTDKSRVTEYKIDFDCDKNFTIPPIFFNYINIFDCEDLQIGFSYDSIVIKAGDTKLVGILYVEVNNFPIKSINDLLNKDENSYYKINRKELIDCINRINVFYNNIIGSFIYINIVDNELTLTDEKSLCEEKLTMNNSGDNKKFSIYINSLLTLLNVLDSDEIELCFTASNFLKLKGNNIRQIVSYKNEE